MTEIICLFSIHNTFEVASNLMRRILNLNVSYETMRLCAEKVGKLFFKKDTATYNLSQAKIPLKFHEKVFLLIDGLQINTLEGWREFKLALFYNLPFLDPSKKKEITRTNLFSKRLVGVITKDYLSEFSKIIKNRMQHTGYYWTNKVVLISDGADWIAKLFQKLFPNSEMVLDWYHAMQHLWACGNELFGEGSKHTRLWVKAYEKVLWDGGIDRVLEKLLWKANISKNQTPLRKLYSYYEPRKDRMRYKEFREKGYPIGSGSIESANSYSIQNRLKRSCMRWKVKNANFIAHLRNIYYSLGEWDGKWKITD